MGYRYPDLLDLSKPEDREIVKSSVRSDYSSYSYSYATTPTPTQEHAGGASTLHDPIHGGLWVSPKGTSYVGTLSGLVVISTTGNPYLLSNRHVFFAPSGIGTTGKPIVHPPGSQRVVGYTRGAHTTPNTSFKTGQVPTDAQIKAMATYYDCSLANVIVPYTYNIPGIGIPTGHTEPKVGMKLTLAGGKSGITHGQVTVASLNTRVLEGPSAPTYRYAKNAFKHSCASQGGDSGSPIVETATRKVVGLHFAGNEANPGDNIGCRASAVAKALKISFVGKAGTFKPAGATPTPTPSPTPSPTPTSDTDPIMAFVKKNPGIVLVGGAGLLALLVMSK